MAELTRPGFLILLALAERDLHGLGIADSVAHTTNGAVDLGPGTLYRTLRLLTESGWIREARAPSSDADPRRKYYAITAEGLRRAAVEAEQLSRIARVARERRLIPGRA
jgi:DNA-binding PadR family transcriptional regulator